MRAQRPAGIATRAGLMTGLFIGVLSLPVITISGVVRLLGLRLLFFVVACVAFAIAGYLATRRSGRLRSGVGAGALAAVVAVFIALCCGVVIVAALTPSLLTGAVSRGPRIRRGALELFLLARLAWQALYMLGAGAVSGLIGGALGRLGRPQPQFASATPFTPTGEAAGAAYQAGSSAPQPIYPSATPYDSDAPTIITPTSPRT